MISWFLNNVSKNPYRELKCRNSKGGNHVNKKKNKHISSVLEKIKKKKKKKKVFWVFYLSLDQTSPHNLRMVIFSSFATIFDTNYIYVLY